MNWYEEDVKAVIKRRGNCLYNPETVFYGSSSFTLWSNLENEFEEFKPINLGFGGSTLAACVQFFDRIVAPLTKPQRLILYAGDNDLGDGADPYDVYRSYKNFKTRLRYHFDDIPFYYVSIKPSIERVQILDKIIKTNHLIKDEVEKQSGNEYFINIFDKMLEHGQPQKKYFEADGLHLNSQGYKIWKEAIMQELMLTEQVL